VGLDLGTGSLKALAVDGAGTVLAVETAEYPLIQLQPGWLEQRAEDWWAAACLSTRRLLARPELAGHEIAGVGLAGQMHGATLLDTQDATLRYPLIWADERGGRELAALAERLPAAEVLAITGSLPHTSATLAKLLWVRAHEPAIYACLGHVLTAKDELRRRLTGVYATDPTDASGTLLYDIRARQWSATILAALELDAATLPPVCASDAVTGAITLEAAAATGLPAGVPVAAGGGDAECAAFGVGLGERSSGRGASPLGRAHSAAPPGGEQADVLVSLGTAGQIFAVCDRPAVDPVGRVHTLCYVAPDRWHLMGAILAAGHALTWLARAVAAPVDAGDGEAPDVGRLLAEAATVLPGADGLLFLPDLLGERSPHMDATARGAFVGLRASHTRAHLARAAVEGVAFALRDSLAVFTELGVAPERVLLAGGAARDPLWRRVLADVLARPVASGATEHGSAYGAARLAARALGDDLPPAITEQARDAAAALTMTPPHAPAVALYDRLYALYHPLYDALGPTFSGLEALREDRSTR
jgi:xylulokinase